MAKKLVKQVKLQIEAAKATPAPPVGPALGQAGVNIVAFTKEFNERTAKQAGLIIPVVINVYEDRIISLNSVRSYHFQLSASSLRFRSFWIHLLLSGNRFRLS